VSIGSDPRKPSVEETWASQSTSTWRLAPCHHALKADAWRGRRPGGVCYLSFKALEITEPNNSSLS